MDLRNLMGKMGVFAACTAVLGAVSCTDADYDFSKEIDRTIDIDADLSMPIGSSEFIEIGRFLKLDDEDGDGDSADSFFRLDGDKYVIAFDGGEPVEMGIDVPDVVFEPQAMLPVIVQYSDYDRGFVGKDPSMLDPGAQLKYEFELKDPKNDQETMTMDIEIDAELPDEIADIESATVNSSVSFNFELGEGEITVKKGAEIVFPDFFTLEAKPGETEMEIADKHILRFLKDVPVSGNKSMEFLISKIDLSGIPGHGIVTEGDSRKLSLNEKVVITGTVGFDLIAFNPVPESVRLTMFIEISTIEVESARVKLRFANIFEATETEIGEMPEFLSGDNLVLDFWNPAIKLKVDNATPLTSRLDADIETFIGDERQAYVHIGANGPDGNRTDAIVIAPGEKTIALSRQGTSSFPGAENIKVEKLGDLFRTIPEKLAVNNISVSTPDEWTDVDLSDDKPFEISMEYAFECPVAFGRDLHIAYETTLEGLGELFNGSEDSDTPQMTIDLRAAEIKFNMKNTIPWNLSLAASPVDEDGNEIASGVRIGLQGDIAAGSPDKASLSPVVISITADSDGIKKLSALLLTVSLDGDESLEGIQLSREMGIQLTDISARIAGNIEFGLGDGAEYDE